VWIVLENKFDYSESSLYSSETLAGIEFQPIINESLTGKGFHNNESSFFCLSKKPLFSPNPLLIGVLLQKMVIKKMIKYFVD
jgi:hypothetical protein